MKLFKVYYLNSTPQSPCTIEIFAEDEITAITEAVSKKPYAYLYRGTHGGTYAAGEAKLLDIKWDDEIGQIHPSPGAYKANILLDNKVAVVFRFIVKEII